MSGSDNERQESWETTLRRYPSQQGEVIAIPEPIWADLSSDVKHITPAGRARAVARYKLRESRTLYSDARLEGFAFTEPEIITLISGGHVAGHTVGEENQVAGLKQASDYMLSQVEAGDPIEPNQSISDDLHLFIAASLGLKSIAFRGDQTQQYEGPMVQLLT
ncbi:hypothetical protein ACXR2T_09550 [Leucobacter sp. HY1910]